MVLAVHAGSGRQDDKYGNSPSYEADETLKTPIPIGVLQPAHVDAVQSRRWRLLGIPIFLRYLVIVRLAT